MPRVLVTGGTGVLGRESVTRLKEASYAVRVMSRKGPAHNPWPGVEWAQADLETGSGLAEAVSNVDTVIHAATDSASPTRELTSARFSSPKEMWMSREQAGSSRRPVPPKYPIWFISP